MHVALSSSWYSLVFFGVLLVQLIHDTPGSRSGSDPWQALAVSRGALSACASLMVTCGVGRPQRPSTGPQLAFGPASRAGSSQALSLSEQGAPRGAPWWIYW